MSTSSPHSPLKEYLEEVAASLPRRGRADVLLELESHILDRAEEEAGGEADEATVRAVLERLGDPARVAVAYCGERYLVGPGLHRAFVVYTALLYVVHLVLILVSAVTGARIHVFPTRIASDVASPAWFELVGVAVHTLLFDIGLMVVIFALASRSRAAFRMPSVVFRVRPGLRSAVGRSALAAIVLVCLVFLRGKIFVVYEEGLAHSVLTEALLDRLPFLALFLGFTVAKEIAYVRLGECRRTLLLDAIVALLGAGLMIVLVAGPTLVAFPEALKSLAPLQPGLNDLVRRLSQLLLVVLAVALSAGAVKRVVRLRQVWS